MPWLALLSLILGTAVQNRETSQAAERATKQRNIGREKEKEVEDTQRSEVLDNADALDPILRQEALDTKASETEAKINAVLGDNEISTSGDVGVISDKVLAQRAQSTREKANNASILAALMSKVRAPGDTAGDEKNAIDELMATSRGRTQDLRRIGRTTNTLAELEGTPDAGRQMLGGLMQSLGTAGISSSIMSGLQAPGAGAVGKGAAYTGVPQASAVPNYLPPDAFNVAGIR